ncbi:MAG TPA: GNAT family N-acetyltransferase [Casimicrobiaceae bacterium]|nr:GNAT family N-acetyltransferase [Casimicrobiaceae bacterium]
MTARDFIVKDTLRNGQEVTFRAVRPDDGARIAKAFRQLDRESVYTRFFTYKSELSNADLARIEAIDFVRQVMLVATILREGDEIVIGGASYIAHAAPDGALTAEVAFTVEEDYQGLGIAGRLLGYLVGIARDHGIVGFEADVLADNKAMLAVFTRAGLPMRQQRDGGVVHLAIDLVTPR